MIKLTEVTYDSGYRDIVRKGPIMISPSAIFSVKAIRFSNSESATQITSIGATSVTVLETVEEVAGAIAIVNHPMRVADPSGFTQADPGF